MLSGGRQVLEIQVAEALLLMHLRRSDVFSSSSSSLQRSSSRRAVTEEWSQFRTTARRSSYGMAEVLARQRLWRGRAVP
ncbi:hypothetical protein E2C01_039118 [Portunus trituberculatus]|uniref:Uncharacterized protein n=1 Tax=Portunus trituberculatus TaxID=210409 RepID=A0A5B7FCT0_PORTR|nr:hypothetical protein [Portunus trituberculatus]